MIYVPELIEKLEQLVNDGTLRWCDNLWGTSRYIFNFPFKTDTCDIFNSITDRDLINAKNTEEWVKGNKALYVECVHVFVYHKRDWRREQDGMENYGWMLKVMRSVEAVISHIKQVYKHSVKIWADSQEKILLSEIDAL